MALWMIIGIILLLYGRTLSYRYIIDDNVKRDGYMYEVPLIQPNPDFYKTRPSKWYRCFMIGMHCVNTSIIYMLWGWCPALLFAVHPQCVWGVAWVTGNYYATTAYFSLIVFYILHTFPNIWGACVAMPIFAAALNSTVCGLSFPFLFLLTGNLWGCFLFIPLVIFLRGKRFTTGLKIRDSFKENKPLKTPFTYKRLFLMVKVMGKYITDCLWPDKIGLFPPYGHGLMDFKEVYDRYEAPNLDFWKSLIVAAVVAIAGLFASPVATLWFFLSIGLHSQWRLTGQFYAQRYLYFALVGLCVVGGIYLQPHPVFVAVVATFFALRSFMLIPAFASAENLYISDLEAWPDCALCHNNLAQWYLNSNKPEAPLPAWRINQIGYLLFKAEEMEPTDWSIKMNVACFFSLINQWEPCLQKTTEALELVRPLGGLKQPVEILERQIVNIKQVIEASKQGALIPSPPKAGG